MRKLNYFFSIIVVITLPLMIVILSSNLILRTSTLYTYHFNDSQAMDKVYYSVTESEMAGEIASYWSSFSSDDFQVYEVNGEYKDPVFQKDEQAVMKKAKSILNIELLGGVVLLIITFALYIYFVKNQYTDALRNRFRIGAALTAVLIIANAVCFSTKGFRIWLYNSLIGIDLKKNDTLTILLGDPLFETYVLFSTIISAVVLAICIFVNRKYTKPARIFY